MERHRIPPGATCLWDKSVPKSIPVGTTCVPPTLPHDIGVELSPSFGNQTFKGLLNTREDAAVAPARPGSVNTCPAPARSKQGQGGKWGGSPALGNLDFMLQQRQIMERRGVGGGCCFPSCCLQTTPAWDSERPALPKAIVPCPVSPWLDSGSPSHTHEGDNKVTWSLSIHSVSRLSHLHPLAGPSLTQTRVWHLSGG